MVAYFASNKLHLEDHGPVWSDEYLTVEHWQKQLDKNLDEFVKDESLRMFIFELEDPGTIIGTINFTCILRRVSQFCYLGYGLDERKQGNGLMHEGLQRAIRYAFDELNLHRIMANYQPTNERSGRVLKRLGFVIEGYARDYLFLNGQWRDHILTSLTNERWRAE